MLDRRVRLFAVLCTACVLVGGGFVAHATLRARARVPERVADVVIGPGMLVYARAEQAGSIVVAPAHAPEQAQPLGLRCDRVYFQGTRGICLVDTREKIYPPAIAIIFDDRARELARFDLAGVPSRARISPGGRYAAATVFVQGDNYDSPLGMSTRTTIIDLRANELLGDLEQFTVAPEGKPAREAEFNFWGVTFVGDTGRFYATLGAGETPYLVSGDVATRTLRVVRAGIECPSLSPDGTRLAFKRRKPDGSWRLHVLDLATLHDRALAETRNYDDQAEWQDDDTLLYAHHEQTVDASTGAPVNIWALDLDTSAPPRRVVGSAFSPALVRPL